MNEFREDLISGDWVLLATNRVANHLKSGNAQNAKQPKDGCPFEDPEKSGNMLVATYDKNGGREWFAKVVKNKFPVVLNDLPLETKTAGPFQTVSGRGFHEVVVYRDHDREIDQFSGSEMAYVFKIFQERYRSMIAIGTNYVLLSHNSGPAAGASIDHPHSQIFSMPIIPPMVDKSLENCQRYFQKNKKKVFEVMVDWELKEKKRVVCENDNFAAICVFASRLPYEVRVFSKRSHSHFEKMPDDLLPDLGGIMSVVLKKINKVLGSDFNFYIHTSPAESTKYNNPHEFYSWHIEIVPRVTMLGALELGSEIFVNIVDPDDAAKKLREANV